MNNWTICQQCQGHGKKSKRIRKKAKRCYEQELAEFEKKNQNSAAPIPPKGHLENCGNCKGSGLVDAANQQATESILAIENYPHVAIIGGGIGGVALAVACLHRQIPFTLYERDSGFEVRSQGYGLTLQQASRAIDGLGIFSLPDGVISTRHLVHTPEGKVVGTWGSRHWAPSSAPLNTQHLSKRSNVHIARQSLRQALLEQLGDHDSVRWGHQLVDVKKSDGSVELSFQVEGAEELYYANADLVVGADGIRSSVRKILLGDTATPLRYLDCIVILGICPLADIAAIEVKSVDESSPDSLLESLLDSATVFQTANGNERIYIMPYNSTSVMWQLSFPMPLQDAKALSSQGAQALKEEAYRRCQWHFPVPQILAATDATLVSGYPVYDRAPLEAEMLANVGPLTLIGDAAHPMSPFKGQGANQALLDALALARAITKNCRPMSKWQEKGIRESLLTDFEIEMLQRTAIKVKHSAEAALFLHSDVVLHEGDEPRGRCLQRDEKVEN